MALADIIARIDADAASEAADIVALAEEQAESMLAEVRAEAERSRERALVRARAEAASEADTVRASARLAARDRELAARGEMVQRALAEVERAIAALPADVYAAFLARRIVAAASGGERVQLAATDAALAPKVRAAVEKAAPGLALVWDDEPAGVDRGAVLVGDRVRADLSVSAAVAERRDELSMSIARALAAQEGA